MASTELDPSHHPKTDSGDGGQTMSSNGQRLAVLSQAGPFISVGGGYGSAISGQTRRRKKEVELWHVGTCGDGSEMDIDYLIRLMEEELAGPRSNPLGLSMQLLSMELARF